MKIALRTKNFPTLMADPHRRMGKQIPNVETVTLPSGHKVPIDAVRDLSFDERRKREKVIIDKLPTITGSIAGASSRFLKDYQVHREREMRRIESMERDALEQKEREEFDRQRNERKRVFEEEAAKKRERRQRRKIGQSTEGLSLPAEVVQEIRRQEVLDRGGLLPEKGDPVQNLPIKIQSKNSITIVDETD